MPHLRKSIHILHLPLPVPFSSLAFSTTAANYVVFVGHRTFRTFYNNLSFGSLFTHRLRKSVAFLWGVCGAALATFVATKEGWGWCTIGSGHSPLKKNLAGDDGSRQNSNAERLRPDLFSLSSKYSLRQRLDRAAHWLHASYRQNEMITAIFIHHWVSLSKSGILLTTEYLSSVETCVVYWYQVFLFLSASIYMYVYTV